MLGAADGRADPGRGAAAAAGCCQSKGATAGTLQAT